MKNKLIAILFATCMMFSVTACGGNDDAQTNANTQQTETQQETESEITEILTEETEESETVTFELTAGEQGEYGKMITMSAGTDMEESFYAYYVPAGTYEVTNIGKFMTQVNVYEGFSKNEETGYDEYTNTGDIKLIDVEKTATITVPDGWFIEIQEPAHVSLTLIETE